VVIGWVIAAPLVAAALRWASPQVPLRRALLIAIGWPACLLVGLAVPVLLGLSFEGAAPLGVAVAIAGLLAALALDPPGHPPRWDRVLVVTAGWLAGWLWSGSTVWPLAFSLIAHKYDPTFEDLLSGRFLQLAAGGAMSGVVGGILMYLLLRPSAGDAFGGSGTESGHL
jgi:membrane associated rhomboid family serine protease